MKPGSANAGDARAGRKPSLSPLGRRPLNQDEHPSSGSRPNSASRPNIASRLAAPGRATRDGRASSPARGGAPHGDVGVKPRGLGMRAWLRIDPNGDTQVIEADKYAIMRRCSIPARDLRILDPVLVYPSTILGRERAIVINLEHIKAIVTAEEVLLQNYQNPHVQQFVLELQRRLAALRYPNSFDSPTQRSPAPANFVSADYANHGETPFLTSPSAPPRPSDSVLLAPGLTAWQGTPGNTAVSSLKAVADQEIPTGRGKSPLGRVPESSQQPLPPGRIEKRWLQLEREDSLRGRSWSPAPRQGSVPPPKRSPRGATHSPERERVRSLSPPPLRGTSPAPQGRRSHGSATPLLERGRSPAPRWEASALPPPPETTVWAPLNALKEQIFGRKKSYQRLVISPDAEGANQQPPPRSQVLFLEGGEAPAGGGLAGTAPVVLPFEFRALEVILETVCGHLDVKSIELEREAYPALDDLTVKIISANLERVRRFKSRLVGLSVRVQKVRDELEGLLDDDGDMREMYLTDKLLDTLDPLSPQSSYAATGFGSFMTRNSPRASLPGTTPPKTGSLQTENPNPKSSARGPPPLQTLDLSPSVPPPPAVLTPRLGPIQPGILDVGFPPQAPKSSEGPPQLIEELMSDPPEEGEALNPPHEGEESAHAIEGDDVEQAAVLKGGQIHGQAEAVATTVGSHGEAADMVTPLLRHTSSHSQRGLRRGRSRSRSGSRSRGGSRSSASRSSRSSKSTRKSGKEEDVEELEMLLEAYFAQIEGTLNKLSALREYIEDTEDYINIRLDDHQNQLLLLGILITIGTVATTIAIIVGGVFGMNIKCSLFKNPNNFPIVMWSTLAACVVCAVGIVGWLKWRKLLSL